MEDYSCKLNELVVKSGLTQRRISKELDIDESTLSLYLSGKRTPGIKNYLKICDYFKVDQKFFLPTLQIVNKK